MIIIIRLPLEAMRNNIMDDEEYRTGDMVAANENSWG